LSQTTALKLIKDLYGTERREGLDKLSSDHPLDVVDYCFLNLQTDNIRIMRLLNVALLHDVVEDYAHQGYTLEKVQALVGLGPKETRLLNLVTRKKGQEDGYLHGIFAVEDAAIVKLADRIANCRDLIRWVRKEQGFTERARKIYEKYRRENQVIFALVQENFQDQVEDPEHPFSRQVQLLEADAAELERLYDQYLGA
jgi:(p)ppGpp synthase/HD superfamily hydrolase